MSKLTLKKLEKFVAKRNKSMVSNMQFQIDANSCGFDIKDLGPLKTYEEGNGRNWKGYIWQPECLGRALALVEFCHYICIIPTYFIPETWRLIEQKDDQ